MKKITLVLSRDELCLEKNNVDRNNISIKIDTHKDVTENTYIGALIKEFDNNLIDNILSK